VTEYEKSIRLPGAGRIDNKRAGELAVRCHPLFHWQVAGSCPVEKHTGSCRAELDFVRRFGCDGKEGIASAGMRVETMDYYRVPGKEISYRHVYPSSERDTDQRSRV
jgi:hypothetical protein